MEWKKATRNDTHVIRPRKGQHPQNQVRIPGPVQRPQLQSIQEMHRRLQTRQVHIILLLHQVRVRDGLGILDPVHHDIHELLTERRILPHSEHVRPREHAVAKPAELESDAIRGWVAEPGDEAGEGIEGGRHVDGEKIVGGLGVLN